MTYRPQSLPKLHSEALTRSANGMPCTLRIASFAAGQACDGSTVACHVGNVGKGMSTKVSDLSIVYEREAG